MDDQTPDGLAGATVDFQKAYEFDFVKVTPASSFCIKDWGAQDIWNANPEGTRDYGRRVIQTPDDWGRLPVLNPEDGHLGKQLECLRMIRGALGEETPIIQTIFSPLSQAKNLVGSEQLIVHMRRYPDAIRQGLEVITETTRNYVEAVMKTSIDGVFYAIQHAQYGVLNRQEYADWGRQDDLTILEPVKDLWLNLLHLHGKHVIFDDFLDYPVRIINWHDQETPPSLAEAKEKFNGVVCGGLRQWETMVLGAPYQVRAEARDAFHATQGKRFILGTGCVVPVIAPRANLLAAVQTAASLASV